jgi:hypothetical protein
MSPGVPIRSCVCRSDPYRGYGRGHTRGAIVTRARWKDITNYTIFDDDEKRSQLAFELKLGWLLIEIQVWNGVWKVQCDAADLNYSPLKAKTAVRAKAEAVEIVAAKMGAMMRDLRKLVTK